MMKTYQKRLVGVFGDPVDDNPSVVVEQAAFDAAGLPMQYLTIQVKKGDLQAAMEGMKAMNFDGINITMPHKLDVLKYLDEVSEEAAVMGAVNVVTNRGGRLYGTNTDGKGFTINLKRGGVSLEGKKVVILGAGGVARAITVELAREGVRDITIVNIIREEGEALTALLNEKTEAHAQFVPWDRTYTVPADTDILVNATPLGFVDPDEKADIDYDTLRPEMIIADVIPNRESTPFLEEGARRGCRTFNGLQMLTCQGAFVFEIWTGQEAPFEVMLEAMRNAYHVERDSCNS